MVNYEPREAPEPLSGPRVLKLITWNTTGSDDPKKLEQLAQLVWGDKQRPEFADIVVIQEFARTFKKADYDGLCEALAKNSWRFEHSLNEGPGASSRKSYFSVWNSKRLRLRAPVKFITEPLPVVDRLPSSSSRQPPRKREKPDRLEAGALSTVNNPPLAFGFNWFNAQGSSLRMTLYSWHTSQKSADARVRNWPAPEPTPTAGLLQLGRFQSYVRVASEMQEAMTGRLLFVLAGDLNVYESLLTSPIEDVNGDKRVLFPKGWGFEVISGGGSGWDHIVTCHGNKVLIEKSEPGTTLGDHRPLQGTIKL